MKYDTRLTAKLALIFFGILFLVCVWLSRREEGQEEPQGEKIAYKDVEILMGALGVTIPGGSEAGDTAADNSKTAGDTAADGSKTTDDAAADSSKAADDTTADSSKTAGDTAADGQGPYLTYGQYIAVCSACSEAGVPDTELPDYSGRYGPEHRMLKADWYAAYRIMLAYLDPDSTVWESTVFVLKVDEEEQKAYTENSGSRNAYRYRSPEFAKTALRRLKVYVQGQDLLTVVEQIPEDYVLENVWITEQSGEFLECFYHETEFGAAVDRAAARIAERESIADLTSRDGMVMKAAAKTEKIHGRLLRVSDTEIEIEGCGTYPVSENMEIYKLYGQLQTLQKSDLRIGYEDTDYVVEDGRICAGLVSVREDADRIRVLLKNTADNSNCYDAVELVVDGETLRIGKEDLAVGERRICRCAALTDRILVNAEGIKKADNAYRGSIECFRSGDGIVLINELPLEEYLYAVVPSEMPASYPMEALKAQAVCARTYAYRCILHAGLPEEGAHVDDTTSYQVYHNIAENVASTTAVRETDGMILTYQGEPAQNYYYSTSCGVGTDAGIWRSGSGEDTGYMRSTRLSRTAYEQGGQETEALRTEEDFRAFITDVDENDLESGEPWYRWTYTVDRLDSEELLQRIKERYAASPQSVLTKAEGDYYVSSPIERLGNVHDIRIAARGAGGVADELIIETDTGTYKVVSEYNIRSVLCDRKSEAVKQDGSAVVPASLLPSGFFVIETGKSGGNVVGYTLSGGGYGHGAGMSQNAAKALGEEGAGCREILQFFFKGCGIDSIASAGGI